MVKLLQLRMKKCVKLLHLGVFSPPPSSLYPTPKSASQRISKDCKDNPNPSIKLQSKSYGSTYKYYRILYLRGCSHITSAAGGGGGGMANANANANANTNANANVYQRKFNKSTNWC